MSASMFAPDPTLGSPGPELSPGCRACRTGRWLCVFMTMRCNAACPHCPAPPPQEPDRAVSALGSDPEEAVALLDQYGLDAVSFSGGEALLEPDRLRRWLAALGERRPELHLWLYTNGLLATPGRLRRLVAAGLREVRFNLSAFAFEPGPEAARIWRHLREAVGVVPIVTVEVPVDPAQEGALLRMVPRLGRLGVRHLNLHELIPRSGQAGDGSPLRRIAIDERDSLARLPGSLELMERLAELAAARAPRLGLCRCTHEVKRHQMSVRRLAMLRGGMEPWERATPEGYIQCILAEHPEGELRWLHPEADRGLDGREHRLLTFRPAMTLDGRRTLVEERLWHPDETEASL
jgi:pyruvate formate-lyase activating enzyme-like uncharacterized protein